MGIAGITLSTSLVTLFNATLLGLFIYRKIRLDYKPLFINLGKMLLAGFITFGVCFVAGEFFGMVELPKYAFEAAKILSIGTLCIVVYSILNLLMRMEYAQELVNRLRRSK